MTKIPFLLLVILLFSCNNYKHKALPGPDKNTGYSFLKPLTFIPELAPELHEISGLLVYNDLFWGISDSGGKNILYGFSLTGEKEVEVEIENAQNNDWEALTQDENYIYIGDFGNNSGARKNLCIYQIAKTQLSTKTKQHVQSSKINFRFSNQKYFGYPNKTTPFDCEAMIAFNKHLYVFSKDWAEGHTEMYKIPAVPGDYTVEPLSRFNVNMLVTGADIHSDNSQLVLLGYNNYKSYLWKFDGFSSDSFFYGNALRMYLKNLDNAQTEGISFWGTDSVLVSTERTSSFMEQVFLLPLNQINDGTH